jgi:hypothetical protein
MDVIDVPVKAEGKAYAVVLRTADFSHGNLALRGAFGGTDRIPTPTFGQTCACCNQRTERRQAVKLVSPSNRFEAPPLDLPVCEVCSVHAAARSQAAILGACGLMVGGPLAPLGFFHYKMVWLGAVGLAIFALSVWFLWRLRTRRLAESHSGHHPGLELMISPRQLVVRTFNREFARDVAERNRELVAKVR